MAYNIARTFIFFILLCAFVSSWNCFVDIDHHQRLLFFSFFSYLHRFEFLQQYWLKTCYSL
ncbi:hypothetical protein RchiOBHm_Chr4g0403111 [Rosa chinensis]|uniref:Uncharacterized protein n=1 Tax=Rosa chinensis TaxID=74649 RepID=A0A2P6QTH6_ROSCH|nr:hypothetical protein RchiOBHm_Chr4g0403111 [Rosa chinensis]